ncbi:MAG: hypothetical protein R6U96_03485 [Promethearchaeia archaeon]
MIHNILILKRSGENLFGKGFPTEKHEEDIIKWNDTLTSGFISAMFGFTQKTFKADINDIEIGPFRVLFESAGESEEDSDDLILAAFFDRQDSIINVREKLLKLKKIINEDYCEALSQNLCDKEAFVGLEKDIEKVMEISSDKRLNSETEDQLKTTLNDFRSNSEILDCDLITVSGVPLAKEWKREFLQLCLRQIDAFWKSKQYVVDQIIISYRKRHVILYKVNEQFVLTALLRRKTPLGMATLLVEEAATKINKISVK